MERPIGNLCDCIPDRDLDGADRDRAVGIAADLLAVGHRRDDTLQIEIFAACIKQRLRGGAQNAGNEALAHLRPAGIAAGRIEGEAGDRPAVAHHVGDDGDDRGRHFGEVEARIPQIRFERDRGFANIENAHRVCQARARPIISIAARPLRP
jgi:hypothetical protein